MRLLFPALTCVILMFILTSPADAQRNFDTVQVRSIKITDSIYMLTGSGGNIGVCSGEDGVFIIDDQFAPLTKKISDSIAKINPKPIRFVMNTHWHGDHTGGNENMGKSGAIIVAHENVRKRMSAEHFNDFFKRTTPPSPKDALPVVTFTNNVDFHLNGDDIHIFHVNSAHTDGDAIIQFTKANVVHMGDVYFSGFYPIIDASSGGSLNGMIEAVDQVLPMLNDQTKIICGHGPLSNIIALKAYRNMLAAIRDRMVKLVSEGKTLDEVKAAKPTADFDEKWGNGFLPPDQFVTLLYSSLTTTGEGK